MGEEITRMTASPDRQASRKLGYLSLLAAMALATAAQKGSAQSPPPSHVSIELISEETGVRPGKTLWVGLAFQLEKEWHVYWQNPGDSGQTPTIRWYLPKGFRAGAVRWPRPKRLGSGSVVDYGYEDEVLLMVSVTSSARPPKADSFTIAAEVKYLVCREICIPGKTHVTLTLPTSTDGAAHFSESRARFQRTRELLPKPAPQSWKISAESAGDYFTLTISEATGLRDASFFPLDAGVIENAAEQRAESSAQTLRLRLKKSDQLVRDVSVLRGVIETGAGGAFAIAVPVHAR